MNIAIIFQIILKSSGSRNSRRCYDVYGPILFFNLKQLLCTEVWTRLLRLPTVKVSFPSGPRSGLISTENSLARTGIILFIKSSTAWAWVVALAWGFI